MEIVDARITRLPIAIVSHRDCIFEFISIQLHSTFRVRNAQTLVNELIVTNCIGQLIRRLLRFPGIYLHVKLGEFAELGGG